MNNLSQIAFKIVNNILEIHEKNIVSVSGEIHNSQNNVFSLNEIAILEELSLAIRKKKAFPFIEISTERLKERFLSEIPEDVMHLKPEYYLKWLDDLDAFIEIGWKNINQNFVDDTYSKLQKMEQSLEDIWAKIIEQQKKFVFLNFPSPELATILDINYENLLSHYLKMLDSDYKVMYNKADDLTQALRGKINTIFTKENTLSLFIKNIPPKAYYGNIQSNQIVILPTGKIEMEVERSSLNGIYFAEKIYYKKNYYNSVKILFEDGDIRYLTFSEEKKGNFILENALMNSKMFCSISIGLNSGNRTLTNYYSYDRCIDKSVSFKFFDANEEPILVLNRQAIVKNI
ncbi:MAG: hypothetical protein K8S23_01700 [Candidatus Cloacimonetes bacterium]|nr:hypothetical protein [Candidatus Cloacimonadota bacterium]